MKRFNSATSFNKNTDIISPFTSYASNSDLRSTRPKIKIELTKTQMEPSLDGIEMAMTQTPACISEYNNLAKFTSSIGRVPQTTKNKEFEGNITFNEDSRANLPTQKRRIQYKSLISRLNNKTK